MARAVSSRCAYQAAWVLLSWVSLSSTSSVREISTIAGGCEPQDAALGPGCKADTRGNTDGIGTDSSFSAPTRLSLDFFDNVYVADTGNHRIRKLAPQTIQTYGTPSPPYTVTTIGGSGVAGYADGVGTNARFNLPRGIATWHPTATGVDLGTIMLFIADSGNHAIRRMQLKIDPTTQNYVSDWVVDTLAGAPAQGPFPSHGISGLVDSPLSLARFSTPVDLTIVRVLPQQIYRKDVLGIPGNDKRIANNDFELIVVDQGNNRLRKVTRSGTVQTYAGEIGLSDQKYDAPPPHCNEVTTTSDPPTYVLHNTSEDKNALCADFGQLSSISSYRRWNETENPFFQDGLRLLLFDSEKKQLTALHQRQNLAFYSRGEEDYIDLQIDKEFQNYVSVTVELWIRPNEGTWTCNSGYCSVWTQVDSTLRNVGLSLFINDDDQTGAKALAVGKATWLKGCDEIACVSTTEPVYQAEIQVEEWSHIAMVMEFKQPEGTGTCKVYHNGELVLEYAPTVAGSPRTITLANGTAVKQYDAFSPTIFTGNIRLAGAVDSEQNFRGWLDEFRVWSFAKTQAEVKAQMFRVLDPNWDTDQNTAITTARPVIGPKLLVYINFDSPDEVYVPSDLVTVPTADVVKSHAPWSTISTNLVSVTEQNFAVSFVGFGYAPTFERVGGGISTEEPINFDTGVGVNLSLGRSEGIAHNQAGQAYFCDWEAGLVRTIGPTSNTIEWYAGVQNLTTGTFETRFAASTGYSDVDVTNAQFNLLYGIAVPPTQFSDNVQTALATPPETESVSWYYNPQANTTVIYLADTGNNRIRRIVAEQCDVRFCNGRGVCQKNGWCGCPEHRGPACTHECPQAAGTPICNGGTCVYDEATSTAVCQCLFGLRGSDCTIECPLDAKGLVCSGQGMCTDTGTCQCPEQYWEGSLCEIAVAQPTNGAASTNRHRFEFVVGLALVVLLSCL